MLNAANSAADERLRDLRLVETPRQNRMQNRHVAAVSRMSASSTHRRFFGAKRDDSEREQLSRHPFSPRCWAQSTGCRGSSKCLKYSKQWT